MSVSAAALSTVRVPQHFGYSVQPQNALPALSPLLATRRTMALEQLGQLGQAIASGAASAVAVDGVTGREATGASA